MTLAELLARGAAALPERPGLPDPRGEARFLLARLLGRDPAWLLGHADEPADETTAARFDDWLARRAAGEPAHYIVGSCPFWGREFLVAPGVLIPRPETELIVERALASRLPPAPRVLDVATGSGCLAVTLALELATRVVATDVSLTALAIARRNAARHGARVASLACDLATTVAARFDLVVANLPYLAQAELASLEPEVRVHEPHAALVAPDGGLGLLRRLIADLPRLLAGGGIALLELGPGQASTLAPDVAATGLAELERVRDARDADRVLVLSSRLR